jgi:hypothetical protein
MRHHSLLFRCTNHCGLQPWDRCAQRLRGRAPIDKLTYVSPRGALIGSSEAAPSTQAIVGVKPTRTVAVQSAEQEHGYSVPMATFFRERRVTWLHRHEVQQVEQRRTFWVAGKRKQEHGYSVPMATILRERRVTRLQRHEVQQVEQRTTFWVASQHKLVSMDRREKDTS